MFEWLRKAPWGHPAFAGMFLSLVFFGFIGGISGVVLGTEQLNVLMHNTIYVPGHFHGTVVAGTTLAFMAATYLVLPLIFEREIVWPKLAKMQPYLFGIGAAGISLFMMGAGTLGVAAPALGHHLQRRRAVVRPFGRRVPDDGPQRHLRDHRGDRRHHLRAGRGRHGVVRREDHAAATS